MATKDYKARERSRPNRPRRGGSGFFWFVTGAVCGAFGVGLAWTLHERTPPAAAQVAQGETQSTAKPSFVFHQLLPEMEVLVPDEESNAAPPTVPPAPVKPAPDKAAPPATKSAEAPEGAAPPTAAVAAAEKPRESPAQGASYLVQVASFRTAADAERLKAKLALLGIQTSVQQVTVDGKEYHRVRAGPYAGADEVKAAQTLLSSKGFDSLAVKVK